MIEALIMAAGANPELYRQLQKLVASDGSLSSDDESGESVAVSMDGKTCAIGSAADDSAGSNAGSVYIWARSGDTWSLQQRLQAGDAGASDKFGSSVALSSDGSTCVIGAAYDSNSGGSNAGSAYVFTRSGVTWTQQQRLQASDAAATDLFGWSVSVSSDGNTCTIGSVTDDNSGGSNAGSVYVFTRSGVTWTQQQRLQASDAAANDKFGSSVAISSDGSTCAVGSPSDINSGGEDAGSVYVFTRSGVTWTQQQRLQASDAALGDKFGSSVSLSGDGNTCAVGANLDNNADTDAGSVYIWTRTGSTWTEQQRLQASDAAVADRFGNSVALSSDGNTCAIGSHQDNNSGGSDAGSVYIWTRTGSTWTEQQRLQASDAAAGDLFGYSVSMSGDGHTCLVGAYQANPSGITNAGAAYVFLW